MQQTRRRGMVKEKEVEHDWLLEIEDSNETMSIAKASETIDQLMETPKLNEDGMDQTAETDNQEQLDMDNEQMPEVKL